MLDRALLNPPNRPNRNGRLPQNYPYIRLLLLSPTPSITHYLPLITFTPDTTELIHLIPHPSSTNYCTHPTSSQPALSTMSAFVAPSPLPLRLRLSLSRRLTPLRPPPFPRPPRISCVSLTASGPGADSTTSSPSEFKARFDDLRGKPVEPVSATVARFNDAFMRPIPIVYRNIINELLTTTHLATVCAMWRFDAVFAYGFDQVFDEFLRYYPDPAERDLLYRCCVSSLGLDLNTIKDSAAAVADWIEGKTEDDIFSALAACSPGATAESVGPVIEALAFIRDAGDFDWYYSRMFGIGLIQVMSKVGVELSVVNAEAWAEKVGMEKSKVAAEMGAYLSSMERLKQAEQIFAESTAREAKKTAERLAARAAAAAKEAEELEKEEVEVKAPEKVEGEPAPQDSPTTSA